MPIFPAANLATEVDIRPGPPPGFLRRILHTLSGATRPRSVFSSRSRTILSNSTERVRTCLQVRKNGETLVVGAIAKVRNLAGEMSWAMKVVWRQIPGKKFVAVRVGFDSDSIIGTFGSNLGPLQ